eukprot:1907588-Pyramimonas_sp.AAC.1
MTLQLEERCHLANCLRCLGRRGDAATLAGLANQSKSKDLMCKPAHRSKQLLRTLWLRPRPLEANVVHERP